MSMRSPAKAKGVEPRSDPDASILLSASLAPSQASGTDRFARLFGSPGAPPPPLVVVVVVVVVVAVDVVEVAVLAPPPPALVPFPAVPPVPVVLSSALHPGPSPQTANPPMNQTAADLSLSIVVPPHE